MLQAAISLSQDSRVCVTIIMARYPSVELNLVDGHLATKEIATKKSNCHHVMALH